MKVSTQPQENTSDPRGTDTNGQSIHSPAQLEEIHPMPAVPLPLSAFLIALAVMGVSFSAVASLLGSIVFGYVSVVRLVHYVGPIALGIGIGVGGMLFAGAKL